MCSCSCGNDKSMGSQTLAMLQAVDDFIVKFNPCEDLVCVLIVEAYVKNENGEDLTPLDRALLMTRYAEFYPYHSEDDDLSVNCEQMLQSQFLSMLGLERADFWERLHEVYGLA